MLFWILIILACFLCGLAIFGAYQSNDIETASMVFLLGFLLSIPPAIIIAVHANQISKIQNQQILIQVYEQEIEALNIRLNEANYQQGALLNADSPVSSLIMTLSEWQAKSARAKAERAQAIISVEARRLGVMSGVITFVGDYK